MTTSSFRAIGLLYFGPLAGVAIAIFLWVTSQHSPYAVLDDYRMVAAVKDMRPFIIEGHSETEFNTGRFVPALLFDLVWTGVRSINDLWYVRVLGLLLVAGSVVLYQIWFMGYAKITSPMAKMSIAISSFIVVLLPTVSATTTWAQKLPNCWHCLWRCWLGYLQRRLKYVFVDGLQYRFLFYFRLSHTNTL